MAAQEKDRIAAHTALVNEDLGYPIAIGDDLVDAIVRFARYRATRVVILCDANPIVEKIGRTLAHRLGESVVAVLPVPLGEQRKRLSTVERILDDLSGARAQRDTLAIGVGGGVAADVFGFAASTFMRGIAYAHVATTLTAMVDAAIGGKTGVNLHHAKNTAGAFRDPIAVFCDVDALEGLPFRALREGLAEVVKAGIVAGVHLFEVLEELAPHPFYRWPWVAIVAAAIKVKTSIVALDPFESGVRETLNLGHTFAHGIEAASNFRITHGAAVALGLRAAGLLALETGRFSEEEHLRVLALLALLGMPLRTTVEADDVLAVMMHDKKGRDGRLRFVLPRALGDVEHGVACTRRQVRSVLARLQRTPGAPRL